MVAITTNYLLPMEQGWNAAAPEAGGAQANPGMQHQVGTAPFDSASALTNKYMPTLSKSFASHFDKLRAIAVDEKLWVKDAEPPTDIALGLTWVVVNQLYQDEFVPTKIVASSEGGVAVSFVAGDKYADIECLNSGEILGVTSNRRDRPTAWEIKQDEGDIARAIARISQFINA